MHEILSFFEGLIVFSVGIFFLFFWIFVIVAGPLEVYDHIKESKQKKLEDRRSIYYED